MHRDEITEEVRLGEESKGACSCCLWMLFVQVALTVGVFLWVASTFKGCC